jgi:hypothetical protein
MTTTTSDDPRALHDQYVAMWNEPDPTRRHLMVDELFSVDAVHRLLPPSEMVEQARQLGFPTAILEVSDRAEMRERVDRAYEEFVADGQHNFRTAGTPQRLGPMFKLDWEMYVVATNEIAGRGTEVLTIGADRRIQSDYQFIDP